VETTGAGVLARLGYWRTPRPLLWVIRPTLRWLLFGDVCEPADIRLITSAVARTALVSVGGLRRSIGAQHRLDTLAALGAVPATALVGDRDRLTPPRCAESIASVLPTTELTVCSGAGHMLMLERPDDVSGALNSIVRQVLDAGRTGGNRTAGGGGQWPRGDGRPVVAGRVPPPRQPRSDGAEPTLTRTRAEDGPTNGDKPLIDRAYPRSGHRCA
jgi:hypothetical protein